MKRILIYTCLILSAMLCNSCDNEKEEIKEEVITVSNIHLIDLGQTLPTTGFLINRVDATLKCEVKTNRIKTGDEIQEVNVILKGQTIQFNIKTSPNDFDCNDASCFSTHLITFNIDSELENIQYTIELGINNVYESGFNYKLN